MSALTDKELDAIRARRVAAPSVPHRDERDFPTHMSHDGDVVVLPPETGMDGERMTHIEPNMQNIPIRTEEGPRIRNLFRTKQRPS